MEFKVSLLLFCLHICLSCLLMFQFISNPILFSFWYYHSLTEITNQLAQIEK